MAERSSGYMNKYGDVAKRQELFNALAAVAMREPLRAVEEDFKHALWTRSYHEERLELIRQGMSAEAKKYLESVQEDVEHYDLQVKLYQAIIAIKKKKAKKC